MFEVGQQVVCVDTGWNPESGSDVPMLKKGATYVVTEVSIDPYWDLPFVNVDGVVAKGAMGFAPHRFRPLAKRSDTLTIESFLTIKPGFEEPKRRVVEPVKEGV